MMRLLLALCASTLAGAMVSMIALAATETSLGSADAAGMLAVGVAIAWVLGLLLYAPATWLLRRRGVTRWYVVAPVLAVLVNAPLFLALFILDRIGGVFAAGEALIVALLAAVVALTHGLVATLRKQKPAVAEPAAVPMTAD